MAAEIEIGDVDETYVKIYADRSRYAELKDAFSFYAPGYKFHPKFKAGYWDGRISLINGKTQTVYKGLLPDIVEFCEERNYSYNIEPSVLVNISEFEIDVERAQEFYATKIFGPFRPHDSQLDAFIHCVNNGRSIILAPTANGKSYIIHGLCAFYGLQKKKTLIIIDRSQLVEQLRENLRDEYHGSKLGLNYQTVYDTGGGSIAQADVYITTWQSCYENPASWFKKFDVIIGDEVHKFKATSLKTILEKCGHIAIRHGFTATLDNDSKSDRLTLIGMFGTPVRVATTKELIDAGIIARPTIHAIVREYSDAHKRAIYRKYGEKSASGSYKMDFNAEVEYLEDMDERNAFIAKIESTIVGNTMVAFKREDHGKNIVDAINSLHKQKRVNAQKDVFFINHRVDKDKRIAYSKLIDTMEDATAVTSLGTFATGVNIKNINNIIVACQVKSKITVPQLIGRGLRISEKKNTLDVYDIGDELSYGGKVNVTYSHFKDRLQMYADEGFKIVVIKYKVPFDLADY